MRGGWFKEGCEKGEAVAYQHAIRRRGGVAYQRAMWGRGRKGRGWHFATFLVIWGQGISRVFHLLLSWSTVSRSLWDFLADIPVNY